MSVNKFKTRLDINALINILDGQYVDEHSEALQSTLKPSSQCIGPIPMCIILEASNVKALFQWLVVKHWNIFQWLLDIKLMAISLARVDDEEHFEML